MHVFIQFPEKYCKNHSMKHWEKVKVSGKQSLLDALKTVTLAISFAPTLMASKQKYSVLQANTITGPFSWRVSLESMAWKILGCCKNNEKKCKITREIKIAVGMSSRDRPILLHDNAKPHTASQTKSTLEALNFEVLPHPPFSPDLSPSDYHLFRSMEHSLREQTFENRGHIEKWLSDFFDS